MYKIGAQFKDSQNRMFIITSINNHMVYFKVISGYEYSEWECGEWYLDVCVEEGTLVFIGNQDYIIRELFEL